MSYNNIYCFEKNVLSCNSINTSWMDGMTKADETVAMDQPKNGWDLSWMGLPVDVG